jgi:hypothetical protein
VFVSQFGEHRLTLLQFLKAPGAFMFQNILRKRMLIWIGIIALVCIDAFFILNFVNQRFRTLRPPIQELSTQLVSYSSQLVNLTMLYPKNLLGKDLTQGNHGDTDVKIIITDYSSSPYIEIASRIVPNGNLEEAIKWGDERNRSNKEYKTILVKEFNTSGYYGNAYSGSIREYLKSGGPFFARRNYHCFDWYYYNNQTEYIFSYCIDQENWKDGSILFVQMILAT